MNATMEQEAQKQIERDLREQLSKDRAACLKCGAIVCITIDGRCVSCYSARTMEIFGVCPITSLRSLQ